MVYVTNRVKKCNQYYSLIFISLPPPPLHLSIFVRRRMKNSTKLKSINKLPYAKTTKTVRKQKTAKIFFSFIFALLFVTLKKKEKPNPSEFHIVSVQIFNLFSSNTFLHIFLLLYPYQENLAYSLFPWHILLPLKIRIFWRDFLQHSFPMHFVGQAYFLPQK